MRVRGLKLGDFIGGWIHDESHPMRVRGLKPGGTERMARTWTSHPMRVRGLKLYESEKPGHYTRRTPCGCVD